MSKYRVGDEVTVANNISPSDQRSYAGRLATVTSLRHGLINIWYTIRFLGEASDNHLIWTEQMFDERYSGSNLYNIGFDPGVTWPLGIDYDLTASDLEVLKDGCSHNVKEYFGLNERFNYCTKCGDKV